jgi:hypothetical protein
VVVVLVVAGGVWPAANALAHGSTAAQPAPARSLQADFNNDGADDLAVGAPFEAVGTLRNGGAVNVLYGSAGGLTGIGSQLFTQDSPGVGSSAEEGDDFGSALAAGDFNNDSFTDLAVGVPFEAVGTVQGAGAVNVLYGSASGLTGIGSQLFTQVGSAAETDDAFGSALAAGDFNNDGAADLAVGARGEDVSSTLGAGAVSVLYGSAGGLSATGGQLFTQVGSEPEPGDSFGDALAAGDFNNDSFADLAVGALGEDAFTTVDAGAVSVLPGSAGGLTRTGGQLFTQVGSEPETGDTFGDALAAGDFNNDSFADLAVGAPFENAFTTVDAGAVSVLPGSAGGLTRTGGQLFTQVGSEPETEDFFGAALAAGDFNNNGFADLAAGAPFENVFTTLRAGAVSVLPGSAGGLTGTGGQIFTQDTPGVGSSAEEDDHFGAALATSAPASPAPSAPSAGPSGARSTAQRTGPSR